MRHLGRVQTRRGFCWNWSGVGKELTTQNRPQIIDDKINMDNNDIVEVIDGKQITTKNWRQMIYGKQLTANNWWQRFSICMTAIVLVKICLKKTQIWFQSIQIWMSVSKDSETTVRLMEWSEMTQWVHNLWWELDIFCHCSKSRKKLQKVAKRIRENEEILVKKKREWVDASMQVFKDIQYWHRFKLPFTGNAGEHERKRTWSLVVRTQRGHGEVLDCCLPWASSIRSENLNWCYLSSLKDQLCCIFLLEKVTWTTTELAK